MTKRDPSKGVKVHLALQAPGHQQISASSRIINRQVVGRVSVPSPVGLHQLVRDRADFAVADGALFEWPEIYGRRTLVP